jgi:hypothetical protein
VNGADPLWHYWLDKFSLLLWCWYSVNSTWIKFSWYWFDVNRFRCYLEFFRIWCGIFQYSFVDSVWVILKMWEMMEIGYWFDKWYGCYEVLLRRGYLDSVRIPSWFLVQVKWIRCQCDMITMRIWCRYAMDSLWMSCACHVEMVWIRGRKWVQCGPDVAWSGSDVEALRYILGMV